LFVCLCGFLVTFKSFRSPIIQSVGLAALTGWLIVQCGGVVLYNRYPPHGADGLREIAGVLNRGGDLEQKVFVTPPALMPMLAQYYDGELIGLPENFDLRRVYIPFDALDWYNRSIKRIQDGVRSDGSFWLVYRPELDEGGRLLDELRLSHKLEVEQHYDFSDLYYFTAKP